MPVPTPSPTQTQQFAQQRSNASQDYLTGQAENLYQRTLQELAFGQQLADFNRGADRSRVGIPRQYIDRGVFNSGLYQQGLQDYAQDRLAGVNRLATQQQLGLDANTFGSRGLEDQYARNMMGSYNQEYATKAEIAAALRGIL